MLEIEWPSKERAIGWVYSKPFTKMYVYTRVFLVIYHNYNDLQIFCRWIHSSDNFAENGHNFLNLVYDPLVMILPRDESTHIHANDIRRTR